MLLPRHRQQLIATELRQRGAVHTAELAKQLNTSQGTVRRDLDALVERGIGRRVYGGAVLANHGKALI